MDSVSGKTDETHRTSYATDIVCISEAVGVCFTHII